MKTLDRNAVKLISTDIMDALKAVATKHGIQFSYKGGRFTPSNCTYRIEASVLGDGGIAETAERSDFITYAKSYDLDPSWLDGTFIHGHDQFTIIGLSTRKHKNPVMCKNTRTNKTFIFPSNTVATLMKSQSIHPK